VDDALAAKSARVDFLGILPRRSQQRRLRGTRLRQLGAKTILGEICELEYWLERYESGR
jgi:hypothetical protein